MIVAVIPSENFFLPKCAEGMVEAELEMGDCFMMTGRDEGKFRP